MTIQQATANTLEGQAEWRDRKAEEYPDDERNERAASALRAAAEYVRMLPDDDPRLRVFEAAGGATDHLSVGDRGGEVLRRVGFQYQLRGGAYRAELDKPEVILTDLAKAMEDEEVDELAIAIDLHDEDPS